MSEVIQLKSVITRIEDKYIIPVSEKDRLLEFLGQSFANDEDEQQDMLIESIYFDTPDLRLYRDHFLGLERRFKLRIRRYGSELGFHASDPAVLELKEKERETTRKTRLAIDSGTHARLLEGGFLREPFPFARLNPGMSRRVLLARVQLIRSKLQELQLTPVCRIVYRRRAFERGGLRVTCDERVHFHLLRPLMDEFSAAIRKSSYYPNAVEMGARYAAEACLIMEVKRREETPIWLKAFMDQRRIESVSLSKYCLAITRGLIANGGDAQ